MSGSWSEMWFEQADWDDLMGEETEEQRFEVLSARDPDAEPGGGWNWEAELTEDQADRMEGGRWSRWTR